MVGEPLNLAAGSGDRGILQPLPLAAGAPDAVMSGRAHYAYCSRSTRLRILPDGTFGSSSMNDTLRGTL